MRTALATIKKTIRILLLPALCPILPPAFHGCREGGVHNDAGTYTNPVYTLHENTSFYYYEGKYYHVRNEWGDLLLQAADEITDMENAPSSVAASPQKEFRLTHLWHPQIINTDGVWYIYFAGDRGNTDDHQLYVMENTARDPRDGVFTMKGRIGTDRQNNWAIHAHAFEYAGERYMLWSGWESRRVFEETQCIYIAKMKDPWTLSSERVKISEPEYEWERQWVNPDGYRVSYPIYVNEAPFFFCNEKTDKAYIYYSASGSWTSYHCIGELSAHKGSDLLNPASWTKNGNPVFSQNKEAGIFGPGYPYIVPSPDGAEFFFLYMARSKIEEPYNPPWPVVHMQKIEFTPEGRPLLGVPASPGKPLAKPSNKATPPVEKQ